MSVGGVAIVRSWPEAVMGDTLRLATWPATTTRHNGLVSVVSASARENESRGLFERQDPGIGGL